uniref:Secreted protein n=1 Tax=Panagrellus redivivus TaxID=6233 RepID=A0A7E4W353_PANRE
MSVVVDDDISSIVFVCLALFLLDAISSKDRDDPCPNDDDDGNVCADVVDTWVKQGQPYVALKGFPYA